MALVIMETTSLTILMKLLTQMVMVMQGDMKQLRAVLQGKDGTAMWEALDRMKLSPNDKVVIHKKINHSGTVRVRCGILISG